MLCYGHGDPSSNLVHVIISIYYNQKLLGSKIYLKQLPL
jgi:hypothetical protein